MFKKLLYSIVLVLATLNVAYSQEAPPQEKPHTLFMFTATEWCHYCILVDKYVLTDERVQRAFKDYRVVKVDVDKHRNILPAWGIKMVPTYVMTKKLGPGRYTVVGRWQPSRIREGDKHSQEMTTQSFLKFLLKYRPKKP